MRVPCPKCGKEIRIPAHPEEIIAEASFWCAGIRPENPRLYSDFVDIGRVISDVYQSGYAMGIDVDTERVRIVLCLRLRLLNGFKRWVVGCDPDMVALSPAVKLLGTGDGHEPPPKLIMRWKSAGGKLSGHGMIAHRFDPIWSRLSDWGFPFPPFYRARMDKYYVEDVSADDAAVAGICANDFPAPAGMYADYDRAMLGGHGPTLMR